MRKSKKAEHAPNIHDRKDTSVLAIYRKKAKRPYALKVGSTQRGKVDVRVRNLATGTPDRIEVLGVLHGASAERKLARRFKGFRIRREWYRPAPEILNLLRVLVELQQLVEQFEHTTSGGS